MISNKVNLAVKKKKSSPFHIITLIVFIFISVFIVASLYNKNDTYSFNDFKHNADIKHYKNLLIKAKELSEKYKRITGSVRLPGHLLTLINENFTSSENSFRSTSISSNNQIGVTNSKDLILGMAQDTDAKNLAVFCKSLRRVSNATVIIFVNEPIPHMHTKLAKESFVTLVPFNLLDIHPSYLVNYHPSTLRWILFDKHIQSNKHDLKSIYDRIWMIDVRDSYFQKDPFDFVSVDKPSFHVFNGVEDKSIGQCSWNAGWIKDCFGTEMIKQIGHKNIICSGVSVGTTDMVIKYINVMSNIVGGDIQTKSALVQNNLQTNFFPSCERNGVDQGVHNVLVHTGNIAALTPISSHSSMKIWTQGDGPVANMQARVAAVNDEYIVLNRNHELYSVVHQYDRYPDLQRYLFKTYVDWIDTNNLQSEWEYESSCMKYSYKENVDLFKGVCDLKLQGGATSAASCCKYCDKIAAECKAFTYLGGQCFLKSCSKINHTNNKNQQMIGAVSAFIK